MAPSQETAVFLPLVISIATILTTIVIHGLALMAIVHFVRHERIRGRAGVVFWRDLPIVAAATLLALTAHLVEITIWALVFIFCGQFAQLGAAFYQSAMNYTCLGYGDIAMSASWRLFGPLEAANGMLMFGFTTAMIFAVIQRLVQSRFHIDN